MNLGISNFENNKNINTGFKESDLNFEQKKILGRAWVEMVVDNAELPANFSDFNKEEIRAWLFKTIMVDIDKLVEELGLNVDSELVKKIRNSKDINKKADLEFEYIKKVHDQVDKLTEKFDNSGNKSTKWDSWPKKMRETKEFNCVGATLIGFNLLEKGGIKSYYGNPVGHVVNIVKLSNGDWLYVDFRNGPKNVIKIEPEEASLSGVTVLKIQNSEIDYKFIPIYDNLEAAGSILNNLDCLRNDAELNDGVENLEAKEYVEKYKNNFSIIDFDLLYKSLYPTVDKIENSEEKQQERDRVDMIRDFEKPSRDYTLSLPKEHQIKLIAEIKEKKNDIENLFFHDNKNVLQESSQELKKMLELFLQSLKDVKEKQPEIYQEAIDKIIGRMRNL
jgi:hypothetical protein